MAAAHSPLPVSGSSLGLSPEEKPLDADSVPSAAAAPKGCPRAPEEKLNETAGADDKPLSGAIAIDIKSSAPAQCPNKSDAVKPVEVRADVKQLSGAAVSDSTGAPALCQKDTDAVQNPKESLKPTPPCAPVRAATPPQSTACTPTPTKRSMEQVLLRAEDELSAHDATSDADIERLQSRQKLLKLEEKLAQAQVDAARAEYDLLDAKAASSSGSHRSRSDHGTPVHKCLTKEQLVDKMAQRHKIVEAQASSPAASSLDIIGEATVTPVPVLPAIKRFPNRASSSRDGDERDSALRGTGRSASPDIQAKQEPIVDPDDYARASAVQHKAMLKYKRPPTPPGAHTPRSVVSIASSRTRAENAALKLRLQQAEAIAAEQSLRAHEAEQLRLASAHEAENIRLRAAEEVQREQLQRLDAQSEASRLSSQLQAKETSVRALQEQAQASTIQAAQSIRLAQATAQQVSQHADQFEAQARQRCAEQVLAAQQRARVEMEQSTSAASAAHVTQVAQMAEQMQQMQSAMLELQAARQQDVAVLRDEAQAVIAREREIAQAELHVLSEKP